MTVLGVLLAVVLIAVGAGLGVAGTRRRLAARLAALVPATDVPPDRGLDGQLAVVGRLATAAEARAAAAAAADRRLRDVLDGIPAAVLLFDAAGRAGEANGAGQRLLDGRHNEALVMDALRDLVGQLRAGPPTAANEPARRQLDLVGPPRCTYSLLVRRLPAGELLAIVEDISERRRLEEVRRDFVANISHELKTPIGAIALLAETMSAEDEPELLARLSRRLHREALRVGSTIDDLMMLSRIESGEGTASDVVDLSAVVAEAIDRISPAAGGRGIEIERDLVEPAATTRGDRRQLVSAVFNLLENAVKYSEDRSSVVVRTEAHAGGEVTVEVADRGVGIPTKDLERVFERFYRVDRARSRLTGGTGLGLAIVRHVAQNHGGSVDVRSREGEGSTFTLHLPPMHPAPSAPATPLLRKATP